MAYLRELPESRNFDIGPDTVEFEAKFFCWEAVNEVDVQLIVTLETPAIYRQLVRQAIKAREVGPGMWMVDVPYGNIDPNRGILENNEPAQFPQPPESPFSPLGGPNGATFSFDTTGENVHITQSKRTVSKSTNSQSGTAQIDNNLAIGLSADRVEGCDILGKKFEFTLDLNYRDLSMAYLLALYHLTGTVNYGQRFAGFEKGEVLYMGATGRFTIDNRWTLTHRFSANPNETEIKVNGGMLPTVGVEAPVVAGGVITVPAKRGWDYLWYEYTSAKVGTRMLQIPIAAYVEEVYDTGDFSILPGGAERLKKLLGNWQALGLGGLSSAIRSKVRYKGSIGGQGQGTIVEWKWSDPNLPDNP